MALTQISTKGIKDGTITGTDLATNVDLVDDQRLRFGNSNDLQIYHNGTDSHIKNATGDLLIRSDSLHLQSSVAENYLIADANGAVELYYDHSKKFETTSSGVSIPLDTTFLQIGAGQDLDLHHNGTNSYIRNKTGDLHIRPLVAEEGIILKPNAAVELYYDNSKKFETTSTGATITGSLSVDGFNLGDNEIGNFGSGNDLKIYHDGGNGSIQNVTGGLYLRTTDLRITNSAVTESMAKFFENGAVELYYDNSKKFETKSDGIDVTGEVQCDSLDVDGVAHFQGGDIDIVGANYNAVWDYSESRLKFNDNAKLVLGSGIDLQIYHDGSNSVVRESGTGQLQLESNTNIVLGTEGIGETYLKAVPNGAVELYHNDSKKLSTTSDGIRIDAGEAGEAIINFFADEGDDANDKYRIVAQDSGDLVFQRNTGSAFSSELRVKSAGGIEANYLGTKRFETNNTGAFCTGELGCDTLYMGDNDKVKLGSNDDLQIYHDGTTNIIEGLNSNMSIRPKTGENGILIRNNGSVDLYYDDSKKLETLTDGIKVTGAIEAAGVPLQQIFNNSSTSLTKTGTGTVALGFSSMSMTTKRSNSLIVFSYTISGEIDGNRGQCFYRLFYSTSSDYSGEQAVNNTCFQGNSHAVSDGDFSDSGTFAFTNPVSAGTTIYLRIKYSNSNSGASIEFNQQSLTNQPSGTSNISFFRVEELTT